MRDLAVLTRNYRVYLDQAVQDGGSVTFCSNMRWTSAYAALTAGKPVTVYIVPEDGSGQVEYEGKIETILLAPFTDPVTVENLLAKSMDAAARAGIESGSIETIYSIVGLHKLAEPFPQTKLLKLSDGKPVSENYIRGYCLVAPME